MAAIHDLLAQVTDEGLRERLSQEIDKISKQKKFGLVFEEHLPECTPLYELPVKKGSTVAKKLGAVSDTYIVLSIRDGLNFAT
ncbi:MAG: site-specific DNA-methyltransferase, partial [Lachnospiraceae bacterium]|nr:site-specific DNA-methyltransferase [Lachnospiraceae bacterium]